MITLQQLVGAAERLRAARAELLDDEDLLAAVERAQGRLAEAPFRAAPLRGFMTRDGDKERLVASPPLDERLIEEAIRPVLEQALEPHLSSAVHAWRPGRSTWTAALALRDALAAGHVHVLGCDIADYYGTIDRARLRHALDALVPALAPLLEALAAAPIRIDDRLETSERGIPLGRPVSPLLANAYLLPLDAAMSTRPGTWLRYGDDLLLAASDPATLAESEEGLVAALASLGLALKPSKTRRFRYDGPPLEYLGHLVDAAGVWERVAGTRLTRITTRGRSRTVSPRDSRGTPQSTSRVSTRSSKR